ncbi:MAG: hypothetical protein R3C11_29305 [Planctomycetaceae bacterium]
MSTMMVNQIIETALGGMNLTTTVEGRERYPIRIRYQRNLREQIDKLKQLSVVTPSWRNRPIGRVSHDANLGPEGRNQQRKRTSRCACRLRARQKILVIWKP